MICRKWDKQLQDLICCFLLFVHIMVWHGIKSIHVSNKRSLRWKLSGCALFTQYHMLFTGKADLEKNQIWLKGKKSAEEVMHYVMYFFLCFEKTLYWALPGILLAFTYYVCQLENQTSRQTSLSAVVEKVSVSLSLSRFDQTSMFRFSPIMYFKHLLVNNSFLSFVWAKWSGSISFRIKFSLLWAMKKHTTLKQLMPLSSEVS